MERVAKIEAVCKAHGVALADAAMQFPLGHPAVSSVVLGAVKPSEVERNLKSMATKIPAALWADLKSEKLLAAEVPVPARSSQAGAAGRSSSGSGRELVEREGLDDRPMPAARKPSRAAAFWA